ncbi:MAG: hypothetical protein RLZZ535_1492 [Cyanobacteriota bacterium]|jgi:uncharacterized protein (UPF0276 family)
MDILKDYVGLGLRIDIAKETANNIDGPLKDIECLEVIAEDYYRFSATDAPIQGLAQIAKLIPVSLHGVTLGLASAAPVDLKRADGMARMFEAIKPIYWSEHLSFVRGGGAEIGHLAAAPRSEETIEGTLRNIEALTKHVGGKPVLENIATLINPPCSTMPETKWLTEILERSNSFMLLDLHNLYTNAKNSGLNPFVMLNELPLHRVKQIHLAGGMDIPAPGGGTRLLDDHVHDVPDIVFELLEVVASKVPNYLMVIIERDGKYPDFDILLNQVRQAKTALQKGRATQKTNQLMTNLMKSSIKA